VLIAALPAIIARYPSATAAIVGGAWHLEPKYQSQLREQVNELNIAGHVTFAGHQQDVPRWMQACDVLVHASDCEPFGMTVVEAMSLGKPVVAGASGGPREIITDGVDGLLVQFGDSGALAAAILRYLDDGAFAAAVGNAARQRAEYFSAARFARTVSDAMRQWMLPLPASKQWEVPDTEVG
jgi:glycosyltransferase involved in cell wall biosynthesis